jgi:hypothetical protein
LNSTHDDQKEGMQMQLRTIGYKSGNNSESQLKWTGEQMHEPEKKIYARQASAREATGY